MTRRKRYKQDRAGKHQPNIIDDVFKKAASPYPEPINIHEPDNIPCPPNGNESCAPGSPGVLEHWCAYCRGIGKEFFQRGNHSIGEIPCQQCSGTGHPPSECRKSSKNPTGEHRWGHPDPYSAFCFICGITAILVKDASEDL